VAARLLGLVEVVLDAQVILHGGLVLEEPLAELAGHAANGPVLVPKDDGGKEFRCLSLVPNVWIRSDRHRFGGSGSFSAKICCKGKLYFFSENFKILSNILKIMTPLRLTSNVQQCKMTLM
jgi:hypothetical protein